MKDVTFVAGEPVEVYVRGENGQLVWVRAKYSKLTPAKLHSVLLATGRRRAFASPYIRKILG
jgi:hypothetical protein